MTQEPKRYQERALQDKEERESNGTHAFVCVVVVVVLKKKSKTLTEKISAQPAERFGEALYYVRRRKVM